MKWLIAAGLMILPLAALLATYISEPRDAPRLPRLLTADQPAQPLNAMAP